MIVADLDDGIRPAHPDLRNRIWNNADEVPGDGLDNDANGYVDDTFGMDFAGANIDLDPIPADNDPTDDIPQGGHGTHTAGTIGAEGNNGQGITGVAQKASIMPLRVCGWSPTYSGVYCPYSSQIAAINYAGANGAKIANMSLGGFDGDSLVRDAFAANPNVLFVVSAGNDTNNNDATPTYPCSYDPTTSGISSAIDNVVCVAASDQNDSKASFSNLGKTKVDIAAPGTETLSTYTYATRLEETFETAGWPYPGWTEGGWVRSNSAPLTDYGITSRTTPAQTSGSTRTTTTPLVSLPTATSCRLIMSRIVDKTGGDVANYKVLVDGLQVLSFNPSSSGTISSSTFDVSGAGPHTVQATFSYTRSGGTDTSGFWLSNVKFVCYVPPGQEDSASYEFLQGTSMAAPHVTGAAALLAAYEPNATTLQLKQSLLSTVDPVAMFNPNSGTYAISTGGRLNADKALSAVDALVAPDTEITSGPGATTNDTSATFAFTSTAKTPVSYECRVDAGGFTACTSPFTVNGLVVGGHSFEVRARDLSTAANADSTPASASWTVEAVPQPAPVEPTLKAPAKVTGISVKRKKKAALIRWRAVPNATSYKVRVGKKKAKAVSATKFTVKKLSPKKKYTVKIAAVNAAGSSPQATVKVKKFKKKK